MHPWTRWDGHRPHLSWGEEASSNSDWRTGVQSWVPGDRKTACTVLVREWNGTWVEAAEVNPRECVTSYGRVMDWCFFRISACFCGCRMDSPAHMISHIYHYWCDHLCGLCIAGNTHRTILWHDRLSLFLDLSRFLSWSFSLDLWQSLSFRSVVCDFDSLSEIRTVGFPHVVLLLACWRSDDLSNCRRGRTPHPDLSSMTAQYHVPQSREVARQVQQTQSYPDWRIQVAERAADTLEHWEDSKPPTPSTLPLPRQ